MHTTRPSFILARSIAALIAASGTSFAVNNFWTGTTSTDWNDPTNWSEVRVPVQPSPAGDGFDDAVINTNTGNIATITADAPTMRDLLVGARSGGVGATGLLNHRAGSVRANGWAFAGVDGDNGTYNLADTTTTGGTLTGFGLGSGTLTVGDRLYIGGADNTVGGSGTFNMNTTGTLTTGGDLWVGRFGTGVFNLDAGTVNRTGGWTAIGFGATGNGTFNMSGGTVTSSGDTLIGVAGGTGTMTMTNGSFGVAGGLWVGQNEPSAAGSVGTMTVSGGAVTVGNWLVVGRNGATGTLTISGSATVEQGTNDAGSRLEMTNFGAGGAGTVNLDGGTLITNGIVHNGGGGATTTFNFNGGTLRARQNNGGFMQGLTTANVLAGGAVLDSNGLAVTIAQSLADGGGGGGLTKIGAGTVTLSGANSYVGATTISAGTLSVGFIDVGGVPSTLGASSNAAANLVLDGGTLQYTGAFASSSDRGFTLPAGKTGSIDVSTTGGVLTLSGASAGAGNLAKTGLGVLDLTTATGHTGTTNANGGVLGLTGTMAGPLVVGAGRANAGYQVAGLLTTPTLTLGAGSGLDFDFGAFNDLITISNPGGLTLGTTSLNLYVEGTTAPFTSNGTYSLIDYNGTLNGSLVGAFSVLNSQPGKIYSIADVGTVLQLTIGDALLTAWAVDADGTWTPNANWTNTSPNAIGATAFFALGTTSAPRTITVDAAKTVGNIIFDEPTNSYTIGGSSPITLNNGLGTATISAVSGSHTVAAPIIFENPSALNAEAGAALNVSGDISGGEPLIKTGDGTVTLTGVNNTSTTTTITAGALRIGDGGTTGTLGTGAVSIAIGASLNFERSNSYTVSNALSGGGIVNKNGVGTLTYTGNSTHTGPINLNDGTFRNQGTINGPSVIIVGNSPGGTATLNLEPGSSTSVAVDIEVADVPGSTGTINVSGGTLNVAGHLNVGDSNGGNGAFNQTAGTVTVNSWTAIGLAGPGQMSVTGGTYNGAGMEVGADSVGTLDLSGTGTINLTGNFEVPSRNGGAGSVATVSPGGTLTAFEIQVGGRDGQTGAVGTLVQAGGTITSTRAIIGRVGTGTLQMSAGTMTTNQWSVIGDFAGSTGTVNMTGGTWNQNHTDWLTVGQFGTATFTMSGSSVLNDPAVVDTSNRNTNKGNVVVGRWTSGGGSGNGTWTLSDTATAHIRRLQVGDDANTYGEVNLNGTSSVDSSEDFHIGQRGTGVVNMNGGSLTTVSGWTQIGVESGSKGTVNVNAGLISAREFRVGIGGQGNVNVSGGTLNATQQTTLGVDATGYGSFTISGTGAANFTNGVSINRGHMTVTGGTGNVNGELWVGQSAGGNGLMDVSAGSVSATNWIAVGRQGGLGVLNVKGTGTVTKTGGAGNHIIIGSIGGTGTANVIGGTLETAGGGGIRLGEGGTGSGILNVSGGGIVHADDILDGPAGGAPNQVYLSGGTLRAATTTTTFMQDLDNAIIGPGGATIDTNSNNITLAQPLNAPTGDGVTSIPILPGNGGSGYLGQPIVQIIGDGFGASAIANVVGGEVASITITNPGIGYTNASVILHGGGTTTPAFPETPTLGANDTTGGLTKIGDGTLTITSDGTYGGATTVNDGTLEYTVSQTMSSLVIANGATVVLTAAPSPGPGEAGVPEMAASGVEVGSYAAAVPEPGTLGLLAAGVLGVLGRRRRTQPKA